MKKVLFFIVMALLLGASCKKKTSAPKTPPIVDQSPCPGKAVKAPRLAGEWVLLSDTSDTSSLVFTLTPTGRADCAATPPLNEYYVSGLLEIIKMYLKQPYLMTDTVVFVDEDRLKFAGDGYIASVGPTSDFVLIVKSNYLAVKSLNFRRK
jgi:hypothetical protein